MSAAFIVARHRGLEQLASQIGFYVILNLVFTFGVPGISVGGHLGGLIGGRARRAPDHLRASAAPARPVALEVLGMVAIGGAQRRRRAGRRLAAAYAAGHARGRGQLAPAQARRAPATRSGWSRWASSSAPSTRRGPGRENEDGRVHCVDALGAQRLEPLAARQRLLRRLVDVEAARHHDHDVGLRRPRAPPSSPCASRGRARPRRCARRRARSSPAPSGRRRRAGRATRGRRRAGAARRRRRRERDRAAPEARPRSASPRSAHAGRLGQPDEVVEHLPERARVEGDHVGTRVEARRPPPGRRRRTRRRPRTAPG